MTTQTQEQTLKLEKILIADDREENRNAARQAIPTAEIVSSEAEAIQKINENQYDLVLTDMQMEDKLSGLKVVKAALENFAIPYVISHVGPAHSAEDVQVRPYVGHIFLVDGKVNPQTWKDALSKIENASGVQEMYHNTLLRAKSQNYRTKLDDVVITAVYFTGEGK